MSIASELRKRAGLPAPILDAGSDPIQSGGDEERLFLMPPTSGCLGRMTIVARLLIDFGVTVRTAKQVVDRLMIGHTAFVIVPHVRNSAEFHKRLRAEHIAVHRMVSRSIDVKALRGRLKISQSEFAGRFGLDVASVRNWEQGRTTPDGAAATLLQLIERDADTVTALLSS